MATSATLATVDTVENQTTRTRNDGRLSSQRKTAYKSWMDKDNIKEWTGQSITSLLRTAEDRSSNAAIMVEAFIRAPTRLGGNRTLISSELKFVGASEREGWSVSPVGNIAILW